MALTKYQSFTVKRIWRSQIALAAYNPRMASPEADQGLGRSMAGMGLAEPLVWNELSGTLVSGHRRLRWLDEKEGGQDFELDVAAGKWSPRQEVKLNVLLNQTGIQGEFDFTALDNLMKDYQLDPSDDLGFTLQQLEDDLGMETGGLDDFGDDDGQDDPPQGDQKPKKDEPKDRDGEIRLTFTGGEKAKKDIFKKLGLKMGTKKIDFGTLARLVIRYNEETPWEW